MPKSRFLTSFQSIPTRLFIAVTLLESIIDIIIVSILLYNFTDVLQSIALKNDGSVLPVYLGLFVLAHLFQFLSAIDAIIAQNTIQLVALVIFNTLFLAYSIIQILEIRQIVAISKNQPLQTLVLFIPVMIGLTELVYLSCIYPLYREFGWTIYKQIGADRRIKRMYKNYQFFICILKFDFFLFVSFSLQLVLLVQQNDLERWLTIAATPLTLLVIFLGYLGAKRENKALSAMFLFLSACEAFFFVYKIVKISQGRDTIYKLVFKSLSAFAAISLAALIVTISLSSICFSAYDKGLKIQMNRSNSKKSEKLGKADEYFGLESAGGDSRMSLD